MLYRFPRRTSNVRYLSSFSPFFALAAILYHHYRFETCIFIFPLNDAFSSFFPTSSGQNQFGVRKQFQLIISSPGPDVLYPLCPIGSTAQSMQLVLWISGIAVPFSGALGNPIMPDNLPLYSEFLEASSSPSNEFDTSSPLPFDSAADTLEFSDDASLPLETDRLVDSLDMPVETILDSGPSGPPRENSCVTSDPAFQPYSKRDGDICRSQQPPPAESPLAIEWPNLEKLEQSIGSNRVEAPENPLLQIYPIPGYTRVGDKENLCPMPKRRLCCLGPTFGDANNIWTIINHCRGKM